MKSLLLAAISALALMAQTQDPDPAKVEETIRAAKADGNFDRLDAVAAGFLRVKEYALARRLEDAALEIRESALGRKSGAYTLGLIKIGDIETAQKHYTLAAAEYRRALDGGDRPESFGALMGLGLEELRTRKGSKARDYFERGLRVADSADGRVRILLMLAQADQLDKRKPEKIEERYKAALAAAPADSAERVAAQWCYAKFLEEQKRHEEAEVLMRDREAAVKGFAAKSTAAMKTTAGNGAPGPSGTGKVTQPVPQYHPEPEYTEEARLCKYQGTAMLYIEVGPDGHVQKEVLLRPLGLGLDEKALDAVSQWRFQPGTLEGKPVAVQAQVQVNFRLL